MQQETAPGTPAWLASVNDKAALTLAIERGVITRNMVHQETGLSKPTSSQMIGRLLAGGFIHEAGPVQGRRGPSPIGYAVNRDRCLGVALDVTEESIRATMVDVRDEEYPVISRHRSSMNNDDDPAAFAVGEITKAVAHATTAAGKRPGDIERLLISVPASVSPTQDLLLLGGSISPWPAEGLRALLSSTLSLDIEFDRDVYLAAGAEMVVRPNDNDFAYFWVGWGLGLTTVSEGEIVKGGHGQAGEVGYFPIGKEKGEDLQSVAGWLAVVDLFSQIGFTGRDIEALCSFIHRLSTKAWGDLDEDERAAMRELARRVTLIALPTMFITDPSSFVIGGPIGAAGAEMLAALVAEEIHRQSGWSLSVEAARVAKDASLQGARRLLRLRLVESLLGGVPI